MYGVKILCIPTAEPPLLALSLLPVATELVLSVAAPLLLPVASLSAFRRLPVLRTKVLR